VQAGDGKLGCDYSIVKYSFATNGPIFEISVSGRLTKGEVLAFWDVMDRQPDYPKAKGVILFLHSGWWEMNKEDVEDLAGMAGRLLPCYWAFVIPEDQSFEMVRIFTSSARSDATLELFKEEGEARKWLSKYSGA
jgi:hypothetical protein